MADGSNNHSIIGGTLGRYPVLSLIGVGGMGEVYLAEDTRLGRRVAIKFLPPEAVPDQHAQQRLVREARGESTLIPRRIMGI
jgi:serine/threonine protein kinase